MKKPYRFICRTGKNIEVVFRHIPEKRFSSHTRDMSEAVLFAEDFLANEGLINQHVPLFREFAKDYYIREDELSIKRKNMAFGREMREGWYKKNQQLLDNYIIPKFGAYKIDSITALSIENWLADIEGKKKKTISGNTKRKILNSFSPIMEDAIRRGYCSTNPLDHVTPPYEKQVIIRRALTLYEQRTLFPSSADERISIWGGLMWATYFSFLYDTGFRPAEIAGLRVSDVYTTPKGFGVYTTHTMNYEEKGPKERVKTSGKGMESRVGLLSDISQDLVLRLVQEQDKNDDEWLFLQNPAKKDSWIFPDTANKHMRGVCKRMGIPTDLTQYSLRHTYATYRRGNMDEATLALSMGHSGGGVRDDYDHRTASILLAQLEKSRDDIFKEESQDKDIAPLKAK